MFKINSKKYRERAKHQTCQSILNNVLEKEFLKKKLFATIDVLTYFK